MNRTMARIGVLALAVSMIVSSSAPAIAKVKGQALTGQEVQISNPYYTVRVADDTDTYAFGAYTFATGPSHPATIAQGDSQNILYGGANTLGQPEAGVLTIRSYSSNTDYSNNPMPSTPDAGFAFDNLDSNYIDQTSDANSVTTNWTVNNGNDFFNLSQVISVDGTTFDDTAIRVTTTFTNRNIATPLIIGLRQFMDLEVGDNDGAVMKTINPYSDWLNTEMDWTPPPFTQYQITNDPLNPLLYINGSINTPAYLPAPTAPEKIQFALWDDAAYTVFDYTTQGIELTGDNEDSAIIYYWGATPGTAITVAPGETFTATYYMFAPIAEATPPVENPAPVLPYTGK
jgi:hypothetical protein